MRTYAVSRTSEKLHGLQITPSLSHRLRGPQGKGGVPAEGERLASLIGEGGGGVGRVFKGRLITNFPCAFLGSTGAQCGHPQKLNIPLLLDDARGSLSPSAKHISSAADRPMASPSARYCELRGRSSNLPTCCACFFTTYTN